MKGAKEQLETTTNNTCWSYANILAEKGESIDIFLDELEYKCFDENEEKEIDPKYC